MSVPAGERMIAATEYLYIANECYKLALKVGLKMPKRYTYLIAQPLILKSQQLCESVCRANCIFPINFHEDFIMRRQLLFDAKGIATSLITDISNLMYLKKNKTNGEKSPLIPIKDSDLLNWSSKLDSEIRLINSIIKSDEKRYNKSIVSNNTYVA